MLSASGAAVSLAAAEGLVLLTAASSLSMKVLLPSAYSAEVPSCLLAEELVAEVLASSLVSTLSPVLVASLASVAACRAHQSVLVKRKLIHSLYKTHQGTREH